MKSAIWASVLLGAAVTCQRIEKPPPRPVEQQAPSEHLALSTRPTHTQVLPASSAAPAIAARVPGKTPRPRCMVPQVEPPPPVAPKARDCPAAPGAGSPLGETEVVFLDAPGAPRVVAEVARTQDQKTRGLMYRPAMGSERGMLFPYEEEGLHSFWMRNTCIPLDMLFIDKDGVIVGILEQVPTLNEAGRSVPCPSQYVLELNAGYARAHGVTPGQKVGFGQFR